MGVAAEVAETAAQLEAAAHLKVATKDADPATAGADAQCVKKPRFSGKNRASIS